MRAKAKKVILIGMDGLMPEQIERYKDDIPELKAILDNGFYSPAYSSPYTDTACNWPTIATGAWVGTHGCTSFNIHLPGMELGQTAWSFNSELCQAEYFWHAAERQGKANILINYPCAFPKLLKNGVVIGGDGLTSPDWTVCGPDLLQSHPDETFDNRLIPPNRIVLQEPGEWLNVPKDYIVIREGVVRLDEQGKFTWNAAGIQVDETPNDKADSQAINRYLMVFRDGAGTHVLLSSTRNVEDHIAILSAGEWSGWVEEHFNDVACLRQYKLIELTDDGSRMSIYGTQAATIEGWGYPEGIEESVIRNVGGYIEALEIEGCALLRSGKFDATMLELMQIQADWMARCAEYLAHTETWDNMWIQYHAPDGISHAHLMDLESADEQVRARADGLFRENIRILFKMAHRIMQSCADESTVVCIVSDHGNLPKTHIVLPDVMLHKNGWLVIDDFTEGGFPVADRKKSKAMAGSHGVWLNVKGRERYGCVEPGEEYEKLRSDIIAKLKNMADPETGEALFTLVGRREEFAGMGMRGERIEDIVMFATTYNFHMSDMNLFHTHRDFYESGQEVVRIEECIDRKLIWNLNAVHWGLPEAGTDYASNRPIFILIGPGVRKNARGDRRINLVDVSPTLAHVLGINPPEQAEGRIVREAFCR